MQVEQYDFSDLENFRVEPLESGNDAIETVLPMEHQNRTDDKTLNVRTGWIEGLRSRFSSRMSDSNDVSTRYPTNLDNLIKSGMGPTMNKKDI